MALAMDTIVTKKNHKHVGTVIQRNETGYVLRTPDGSLVVVPIQDISKIIRDNKVYDFDKKMGYYLEKRRPFLPFVILGVGAGMYAYKKFSDYANNKRRADNALEEYGDPDQSTQYLDASKQDMAWGIASSVLSVGSFFIAFKPLQVTVPIGPIHIGMGPAQVGLAMQF